MVRKQQHHWTIHSSPTSKKCPLINGPRCIPLVNPIESTAAHGRRTHPHEHESPNLKPHSPIGVSGFGFQSSAPGLGFRVPGFGVRVSSFVSRVSSLGFRAADSRSGAQPPESRRWSPCFPGRPWSISSGGGRPNCPSRFDPHASISCRRGQILTVKC